MPAPNKTYYFDENGRWSGGGNAFLNNARHAAERHPIFSASADSLPIIPRNFPSNLKLLSTDFVLAPQNAWPWDLRTRATSETPKLLKLRAATEVATRRASAILRISSTIPRYSPKGSPVFHNVLDTGFEAAALEALSIPVEPAAGRIVSIGHHFSYKNVRMLARAYRLYRQGGGNLGLLLIGAKTCKKISAAIEAELQGLPDVALITDNLTRAECLAAMQQASVVVLPSLVEASPFTALEAVWSNPNTIMSSIVGHREIFSFTTTTNPEIYFEANSAGELCQRLWSATNSPTEDWHNRLRDAPYREELRLEWGDNIAEWLSSLEN